MTDLPAMSIAARQAAKAARLRAQIHELYPGPGNRDEAAKLRRQAELLDQTADFLDTMTGE